MAQKCAIGFISAIAAASASLSQSRVAAADGPPPPQQQQQQPEPASSSDPPRARNDNPRTTSGGFDPEALERGATALKEINSSSYAKIVLDSL